MKKIIMLLVICSSLAMGIHQTSAGGGAEYTSDMLYPNLNGLTLEEVIQDVRHGSIKQTLTENFDTIAQNTAYEDYSYNATHRYSKQLEYHVFIPTSLESKVRNIHIQVTKDTYDYGYPSPIMYDGVEEKMSLPVIVDIVPNKDAEGSYVDGTVLLQREDFVNTWEYGSSYKIQVMLELSDKTQIPYSQISYMYISGDTTEWIKSDLSNAYYSSQNTYGYPDVSRLLRVAFEKLEAKSTSTEVYLETLTKVLTKGQSLIEKYNAELDSIAMKVTDDESFYENIESYGVTMQKNTILNDAIWQIQSEIETRKGSHIIDELFAE